MVNEWPTPMETDFRSCPLLSFLEARDTGRATFQSRGSVTRVVSIPSAAAPRPFSLPVHLACIPR